MNNKGNKSEAYKLRHKAEEYLNKRPLISDSQLSEADTLKLIHELQVHQIELEMQYEELIRAKAAQQESSDKYIELYDFAPTGYFSLSKEGNIIELNLSGATMLGSERSTLKNSQFGCFVSHDTRPAFNHFMDKVFHGNFKETCEVTLSYNGHFQTYALLTGIAAINREGCVITVVDITERRRSEELLKITQEKLYLALDNGKIGIWERDLNTNRLVWDKRTEKMFGFEEGTFKGTYEEFEKCLVEEDIPHLREASRKAVEENVQYEAVYRIKFRNGNIHYINAKASVVHNEEGKAEKLAGVCFDITDMKKGAEQTMFRLNEELLRSNKELEQFAYVASHDLQEPLRMVSSFTKLLADRYKDKLDEDAKQFIHFAREGALRSQGLINDLLNYSRIWVQDQEFMAVDFNQVLGIIINNLAFSISEKNAIVTFDELPTVMADEWQMVSLLQNLVWNALKFCNTTARVHISAKEESNQYLFSVQDNGIGIEQQYFDRIFLIFQRLGPRDENGSNGIGLAICKRIVERHGGKIWIESQIGEGTTVYFTIPKTI